MHIPKSNSYYNNPLNCFYLLLGVEEAIIIKKMEEVLEKRKEKAINWLKNPYNLGLVLILIFAFVIRLYYYTLTKNQAIWWDSAEYMNMARAWAFGLEYEFLPVRPVLFSLIVAVFLKIANNEFLTKLFLLILSMASVYTIYLFGKEVYNKKVGLIAALLMSVFYLNIFFTFRLLVEIPSLTFFIFSCWFFYKYFKTKSNKMLYLGAISIAIATLFKLSSATFLFTIVIYLIITERFKILKKKELWIAALIFFLVLSPYLLWGYIKFGGFVITQAGAWNAPSGNYFTNGFTNIKSYFSLFITYLSWPLLIFFILGVGAMYKLILGFDVLIKGTNFRLKRDFYLFLLFLVPIITVSFSLAYIEPRYILYAFPAIFVISSALILKTQYFIKKYNKTLAVIFLIVLLGSIMFFQLQQTDSLIKSSRESYYQVKQAGLWLKENTEPSDIIATKSRPQIKYYAEREVVRLPETKKEFEELLEKQKNITIFMTSIYERHPQWAYSYAQEEELTTIQVYIQGQDQPTIILSKL